MKNTIILVFLFIVLSSATVFSQKDSTLAKDIDSKDSSEMSFRLNLGYNLYSPIENGYHLNIKNGNGWNIGFLFSITNEFSIEGSASFLKFKTTSELDIENSLKANIYHLGFRLYPYLKEFGFYLGLGMSWDNFTENLDIKNMHLTKEYHPNFNSFVIPIGLVYDISRDFTLDFSTRPAVYYPDIEFSRVVFNLSVIFHIEKRK
jgi:hypothetical protein